MTNCVAIRGRDGRCRGFGFASFANADAAAAAAAVPRTLDGRSVYLLPEKTAVVPAAPPPAAAAEPKKQGPQAGRSLFVRKLPKAMSADAARVALVDAAAPHAGAPPRAHVVRRQGGGGHRGFAFIECATPAEASLVLERLRHTPYGWAAEWVRPKGKKGRSGRGRRGGRRRGRRGRQAGDGGGGGVTADYAYASDDDVAELYGDVDEVELYTGMLCEYNVSNTGAMLPHTAHACGLPLDAVANDAWFSEEKLADEGTYTAWGIKHGKETSLASLLAAHTGAKLVGDSPFEVGALTA